VQKREVAAEEQKKLKGDHQPAGDVADDSWPEDEERGDHFDEVVEEHSHRVRPVGQKVKERRERARYRLRLVVKVEAGELVKAPARVAAELDQPRPEHDSKGQPAK